MTFDVETFNKVVYIGLFSGLVLGLSSSVLGVAIDFLYQKIRKVS